jgi:dipeptidyl aminopeptidase/acylaminoacyl peptidase
MTRPASATRAAVTADVVTAGSARLWSVHVDGPRTYWIEASPASGRNRLMLHEPGRRPRSVTADGVSSRVYEYGGGAYCPAGGCVFAVSASDGRIYRYDVGRPGHPITPAAPDPASVRYADMRVTPDGRYLVCVRERHEEAVVHDVVAIPTDGSSPPWQIVAGHDFYAAPRPSPDGRFLAWMSWNRPLMPWQGCELWLAKLDLPSGTGRAVHAAGGPHESIAQPQWRSDGVLHFVSDRTGWWNIYCWEDGEARNVAPVTAETAWAHWSLDHSTYAFLEDGRIAGVLMADSSERLALLDRPGGEFRDAGLPYTAYLDVRAAGSRVTLSASTPRESFAVVSYDFDSRRLTTLRRSAETLPADLVSEPEPIDFPTADGARAHALFYRPLDAADGGTRRQPPLLVVMHGGPTGQSVTEFRPDIHFWTTRGFAVADVNHRGSTGFGRPYRDALRGAWGVKDVEDCVHAARHLAAGGLVDPERSAIRGTSAGGLTVLCALAFHEVFAAGVSICGIADLAALARETHKFEAHYLDWLVGPLPAAADLFRARSPLHSVDRISAPVLFFCGLKDEIVPCSQSEQMIRALRANGVPCALVTFPDEGHGLRHRENVVTALQTELAFYSRIFGLALPERLPPIQLEPPLADARP